MTPDEHLKAALRHAPDAQWEAPPEVSAQILAAAHRSAGERSHSGLAPSPRWVTTVLAWWRQPQAAAGLATVLLAGMVGLLWRGDPPGPGRDPSPDLVAQAPATATQGPPPAAGETLQQQPPSMRKAQSPRSLDGEPAPLGQARAPSLERTRATAVPAAAPAPSPVPVPVRAPALGADPAATATADRQAPLLSNNQRPTFNADTTRSSAEAPAPALAPAPPVATAAAPTPGPAPMAAAAPAPATAMATASTGTPAATAAPPARAMAQPAASARAPLALARMQPDIQTLDGWTWSPSSSWRDPDRQWMARLLQSAVGLWLAVDQAAPAPGSLQLTRAAQGRAGDNLWLEPESLLWCSAGGSCLRSPLSAQQRLALLEQLAR